LGWAILGFAEELEFLSILQDEELEPYNGKTSVEAVVLNAAQATSDFYIRNSPIDGIPYWDTGAPLLHKIDKYLDIPSNPFNQFEPVDSSAAVIAAQGLLRLGHYLLNKGNTDEGQKYWQAGLTVLNTLFDEPYLNTDNNHPGLLLHTVYHRPNGWDNIPQNQAIPCGESTMWGDYHAREVALYVQRIIQKETYYTFWNHVRRQQQD